MKSMLRLSNYLDERLVLFLDSATKEEVLKQLVDLVATTKELPAKDRFYQAILDRERLVSTAIGMGVAIPHAKLPVYSDFFVAIAILHKGIDWNAIDDSLVKLVFLIGGPDNHQTDYLKLLSSLTVTMRDEQLRRRLLTATSPQAVVALLKGMTH
jgi:PTS system nitrogen regulatory IIA component